MSFYDLLPDQSGHSSFLSLKKKGDILKLVALAFSFKQTSSNTPIPIKCHDLSL